jgi:hypothetical protein
MLPQVLVDHANDRKWNSDTPDVTRLLLYPINKNQLFLDSNRVGDQLELLSIDTNAVAL